MPPDSASSQPSERTRLIRACSWGASVLAIAALIAWWAGDWRVLAFARSTPMAPSTALALLLLSGALWFRQDESLKNQRSFARSVFLVSINVACVASMVVMAHLSESALSWETLLAVGVPSGASKDIGRMSLVSAQLLLLATWSLLTLAPPITRRVWVRRSGIFIAGFGAVTCASALLVQVFDLSALFHAPPVPVAVVSLVALLLLFLGLLFAHRADDWLRSLFLHPAGKGEKGWAGEFWFWLTSAGVMAAIVGASIFYLEYQRSRQSEVIEAQLATYVESQAGNIARWHYTRAGNMAALASSLASDEFRRLVAAAPRDGLSALLARLGEIEFHGDYGRMMLLGKDGTPLRDYDQPLPPAPIIEKLMASVMGTGSDAPALDGWSDPYGEVHLLHLLALRAGDDQAPEYFLLLDTGANSSVLPMVQNANLGAGRLQYRPHLWWSDGRKLMPIGDPRLSPPLKLKHLDRASSVFAYPSTLGGRYGLCRTIGATRWVFAASISSSVNEHVMKRRALLLAATLLAGVIVAGYLTRASARRRQMRAEQTRLQTELDRARISERLGAVMRFGNDAIFIMTADGRIVEANERAEHLYGLTSREMEGLHLSDLEAGRGASATPIASVVEQARHAGGAVYESAHRRKDGTTFPVEVSARTVSVGGEPQVLAIVRDITERTERSRQLAKLGHLHQMLHRLNEVVFRAQTRSDLYRAVCEVLGNGGFALTWIGERSPDGSSVTPVASAGPRAGFFSVGSIPVPPNQPSPCLIAAAMHEARPVVSNDLDEHASTQPWHEGARAAGLHSAIGIPLRMDGKVIGILAVYASEASYFGPEEIALLERAGDNLSFALGALEQDERRRAAELELRKLSLAVEQIPLSVIITDLRGQIEYVNPSFTAISGYESHEVIGQNFRFLQSGTTDDMVYREMWETLNRGERWRGELVNNRKNGERFIEQAIIAPVVDETGRPAFYVAVKEDITEMKRVASALMESRRKLQTAERATLQRFNAELEQQVAARTAELAARNREVQGLLQSIPDMVMRLRKNGAVLHCQSAQGDSLLSSLAVCPPTSPEAEVLLRTIREAGGIALATRSSSSREDTLQIGPTSLSVEVRAAPVADDEYVVFVRDITERHAVEVGMARALSKEREASAMKSRFISVTSHEFRTPLAAALGSVDLLFNHLERLAPDRRKAALVRIRESLLNMESMVQEILTLSRAESGRLKALHGPVDLDELAADVAEEARAADRDSHQIEVTGSAGVVTTDRNMLRHVLSNLIGNAIRYSPANTRVEIRLAGGPKEFRVSVVDQGIGVPAADQDRIFEPFERGANVGTIRGTGLGLNIVRRMTDLLGGHINLCSEEGRGSTFAAVFPQPPPEVEPAGTRPPDDHPVAVTGCVTRRRETTAPAERPRAGSDQESGWEKSRRAWPAPAASP